MSTLCMQHARDQSLTPPPPRLHIVPQSAYTVGKRSLEGPPQTMLCLKGMKVGRRSCDGEGSSSFVIARSDTVVTVHAARHRLGYGLLLVSAVDRKVSH